MTQDVSSLASERMAAWFSRKPSFSLMGEYSSGKSALLNCLLGHPLLPTRVTATDLPAVWITEGKALRLWGLSHDGGIEDLSVGDLQSAQAMQFLVIRIETEADILRRTDIIDTPGISDPRMSTAIVEEIAKYSDFTVWCSPLNQAWRQTERAFWRTLPNRLKPMSVLALTRADMMRGQADIDKVTKRCKAETGTEFTAVLPVSAPLAIAARDLPPGPERDSMLTKSGVEPLLDRISLSVSDAETLCAARPKQKEPGETVQQPFSTKSRKAPEKTPAKKQEKQPKIVSAGETTARLVSELLTLRSEVKDFSRNEHILATISHLFSQLNNDNTLTAEHRDVLARALTVRDGNTKDPARYLKQVEHEVEDFADGPWCELGH
jgi:hypothetical protein